MFYQSGKMKLECLREVKKGSRNDVFICRDSNVQSDTSYTLIVIKEHQTAKKYLEIFEQSEKRTGDSYLESFSDRGAFCMVFEYRQERPLMDFYMGDSLTAQTSEEICISLILCCMASNLPFPILYLILTQNQIHLAKDHSVYFGYQLDLEELDEKKNERDCVLQCARIARTLLRSKASQKGFSYRILEQKIQRESYSRFVELYKDIKITASPVKQKGLIKRFLQFLRRHQDTLYRCVFIMSAAVVAIALISLLSQLIFGDIPWLRVLFNGFKVIGSQSLEQ